MNRDRAIVLVGLMGAGKSRVGQELAKILQWPFVDADREIEAAAGLTVSEIFERFGEAEFRRGEKQVMLRLLAGAPVVLASGGGAFIQDEIRREIKNNAISVWLKADLETLVERTAHGQHRPLLQKEDPEVALKRLMDVRYPIYAEADVTVTTDTQTPQEMAENVLRALEVFERNRSLS